MKDQKMARPFTGDKELLSSARSAIASARTIEELRQAQAVVLPLDYGLSLEVTAAVIGVSKGWACQLRRRFINQKIVGDPRLPRRGGRKRENMSTTDEQAFLAPFFEQARVGGVLVVGQIKLALEQHLGRAVALSSVYNLLHRQGWRKLVPDKRHPKSDSIAQDEWKKNSPKRSKTSAKSGQKDNR
jgi:transposase